MASLRRLLRPEPAPLDVELRAVPATTVAAVEDDVAHGDVLAWYAGAMAELDAVVRRADRPPRRAVRQRAVRDRPRAPAACTGRRPSSPQSGRVHPVTLPAVELAVTTHVGEHDDIDVTYGELGAWVVRNALAVAGPVRESYLVGPARHGGPVGLAYRDRLAGLPRGPALSLRVLRKLRAAASSGSAPRPPP